MKAGLNLEGLHAEAAAEMRLFVHAWTDELENENMQIFTYGDIIGHMIAHEIHHLG